MKKIKLPLIALLIALCLFAISACGGESVNNEDINSNGNGIVNEDGNGGGNGNNDVSSPAAPLSSLQQLHTQMQTATNWVLAVVFSDRTEIRERNGNTFRQLYQDGIDDYKSEYIEYWLGGNCYEAWREGTDAGWDDWEADSYQTTLKDFVDGWTVWFGLVTQALKPSNFTKNGDVYTLINPIDFNGELITSGTVTVAGNTASITCAMLGVSMAAGTVTVSVSLGTSTAAMPDVPAAKKYTIVFNDNGGSGGSGSIIDTANNLYLDYYNCPVRANYIFDGYYTSPAGGIKLFVKVGNQVTAVSGVKSELKKNQTVYAHWIYSGGAMIHLIAYPFTCSC